MKNLFTWFLTYAFILSSAFPAFAVNKRYQQPEVIDRSLIFSAVNGSSLTPRKGGGAYTFNRDSTATYIDANGVVQTAAIDEPRFENGQWLQEPQGQNLCLWSEDFSGGGWARTRVSVSADAKQAPDGTMTADGIIANTEDHENHRVEQSKVAAADDVHTFSCFVAPGHKGWVRIETKYTTAAFATLIVHTLYVNLLTGAVGTTSNVSAYTITACANGFYRISITSPAAPATTSLIYCYIYPAEANNDSKFIGDDATIDVYAWGAQIEHAPVPSSYIPTTNSPVTRNPETLTYAMSDALKSIFSVDQGWTTSLDDETGVTFGPEYNRCSFYDGQSWFGFVGFDASPYAGGANAVILRDSTGKLAWGYLGAAGPGETLGEELVTNGGFDSDTSGWTPFDCTVASVGGGQSGNCLEITRTDGSVQYVQRAVLNLNLKKLYRTAAYIKSGTSGNENARVYFRVYTILGFQKTTAGEWIQHISYGIPDQTSGNFYILKVGSTAGTMLFDEVSLKEVTTPAATQVYVYKDAALTSQGWNMESGFNVNGTSYTFDIIPASQIKAQGTVILTWKPGFSRTDLDIPSYNNNILNTQDGNYALLVYERGVTGDGFIRSKDGSSYGSVSSDITSGQSYIIAARWDHSTREIKTSVKAAGSWTHGTPGAFDGAFALGANLNLGYALTLPRHVKDVKIWKRALSDAEIARY